jgi:hypothetical protein
MCSREQSNSNYTILHNQIKKNLRNISEIRPVIHQTSKLEERPPSNLQKKESFKFENTLSTKNTILPDFQNSDNFSYNPKLRVHTSKIPFPSKKQNTDDSDSFSNKTSNSVPSNNLQKIYFSSVGLDNLGNTCYM